MQHNSLVRHGSVYAAGDIGERLIGLLMLPVYAFTLSPSGFGVLAVVQTLTGLGSSLLALGLYATITRYYYNAPGERRGAQVVGTSWPLLLVGPLVALLLIATLGGSLLDGLAGGLDFSHVLLPALGITYLNVAFVELTLAVARTRKEPRHYVAVILSRALLTAVLACLVLLTRDGGAAEVVQAQLAATVVVALGCARHLWRIARPVVDRPLARSLLRFGLPLIPQSTAVWALRMQDRLILDRLADTATVGIYAMGAKLAMPVQVLLEAAFRVLQPTLSEAGSDPVAEARARHFMSQYLLGGVALTLAAAVAAPPLVTLVLPATYEQVTDAIQLLVVAAFCSGVFRVATATNVFYLGRTRATLVLTVAGVALNAALNVLLIPSLGLVGVAMASVLTFFSLSTLAWWTGPMRSLLGDAHRFLAAATTAGVTLCVIMWGATISGHQGLGTALGVVIGAGFAAAATQRGRRQGVLRP
jgi:O-antigen/teichoic acid export membrane protein